METSVKAKEKKSRVDAKERLFSLVHSDSNLEKIKRLWKKHICEYSAIKGIVDENGDTPLARAVHFNAFKVAKYLLGVGDSLNAVQGNPSGTTILESLIIAQEVDAVAWALQHGARPVVSKEVRDSPYFSGMIKALVLSKRPQSPKILARHLLDAINRRDVDCLEYLLTLMHAKKAVKDEMFARTDVRVLPRLNDAGCAEFNTVLRMHEVVGNVLFSAD